MHHGNNGKRKCEFMKNAVITGASGFVGRNLVKYLAQKGVQVFAIVRNKENCIFSSGQNIKILEYDLEHLNDITECLDDVEIDAFYHLAWQGAKGAGRSDYTLQIQNAKYSCDAAIIASKLKCKKFIAVGTITERLADVVLKEKCMSQNLMYGLTKSYTNKLLNVICTVENINFVWAELSNIYGGDDDSGNLISYTIDCFEKNIVPKFGPCQNPYDFIHIDDVVSALYEIGMCDDAFGMYFIGRCENKTLKQYIEDISRIYNKPVNIGALPDDGLHYEKTWFDNGRLVNEMNFTFKYDFENGIRTEMKIKESAKCGKN